MEDGQLIAVVLNSYIAHGASLYMYVIFYCSDRVYLSGALQYRTLSIEDRMVKVASISIGKNQPRHIPLLLLLTWGRGGVTWGLMGNYSLHGGKWLYKQAVGVGGVLIN